MDKKRAGIFWGILLIAGGAYTLARTAGYEITQDPTVWAFIFGGISVFSLIFYFADGVKNWGWLFPAGIFGGLAITLGLGARGVDDPAMAAPLFIGIGLPFIVAFFQDRAHNWWALIPAGAMAFLTLVLFVADRVAGEWIGSGMFFILAATFFVIYLSKRTLWAAIVAYVMFIVGFMPLMAMTPRPELSGIIPFFAIGLPFLYVYLKTPERWWALFPAGILLTLGVVTAVVLIPGVPAEKQKPHRQCIVLCRRGHYLRSRLAEASQALGDGGHNSRSYPGRDHRFVWRVPAIMADNTHPGRRLPAVYGLA